MWKTTDAGQTWTQMTGLPQLWVNSIAVNPANANRAWVAFSGFRIGDDGSHLYETTNGGATWTSVSGILPNAPIENVIFDHATAPSTWRLTSACSGPTSRRPAAGSAPTPLHWFRVGSGLPATPDMDLKINGSDTKLLVGTFGRGLWEVTLPTANNG